MLDKDEIGEVNRVIGEKEREMVNRCGDNHVDEGIRYVHHAYPIEISGESIAMQMANSYGNGHGGMGMNANVNQVLNSHNKDILQTQLLQL